jgi:hypothetical protein
LHGALKQRYGKLRVSLPSKRHITGLFGKTNPEFLESRKDGLSLYLKRITTLPNIGKVDVLLAFFAVQGNTTTTTTPLLLLPTISWHLLLLPTFSSS